jgi:hypothetical protein
MNYIKTNNINTGVDLNEADNPDAWFERAEEYKETLSNLKSDRKDKYDKFIE